MPDPDSGVGSIMYEIIRLFQKKSKIIVTSVYSLEEQKQIIEGASDYYDKSQGIDILLARIKEALREG
jgi:DNA-binding response OmpR family regulator